MYHNIVLIGMMGSGKSSIGRCLSEHYPLLFTDTDTLIAQKTESSIPDFFSQNGEVAFRKIESEICETLPNYKGHIIATGGGIVLSEPNRQTLKKSGWVVYLYASTAQILARLAHDQSRPLLNTPEKEARIQDLLTQREGLYRETSHVVVDTTASPTEIAKMIWHKYQATCQEL